jgi:hypothetical protein
MSPAEAATTEEIRADAAAEERAAVLEIIERYARHLAHGHGANGARILDLICHEVRRRGEP